MGEERWCLGFELREGTQHCQDGTPHFLRRVLASAKQITDAPILVRLDSGDDALENYAIWRDPAYRVDFLVKHNWRREDLRQNACALLSSRRS